VFVKDKKLAAAACCFPFREKLYIEMPFIEVRSPLGVSSTFFSQTPEHASLLVEGLEQIRKRERAKGIMLMELKKEEFTSIKKQVTGFMNFPMVDSTYLDLDYTDFDDYLSWLPAKARRSVRITLNKGKKFKVNPLFTNEFSQWKSTAHRLQGYTCKEHRGDRWHLTEEFYDALERNLKERAELLIIFKDDVPLACVLSLHSTTISQYKFPGVDPQYRGYHAYFLLYYEAIKKGIEKGQKRIYFGTTGYSFKEKIGCKRKEIFGFIKMGNPFLHLALQPYVAFSRILGRKL
jgi:predicted N-acyltransferase